jgi:hypothetical protein
VSGKFQLICIDCLVALRLGKWIEYAADGDTVRPYFQGLPVGLDPDSFEAGPSLLSGVQAFLARHRNHALSVVDWDLLDAYLEELPDGVDPGLMRSEFGGTRPPVNGSTACSRHVMAA